MKVEQAKFRGTGQQSRLAYVDLGGCKANDQKALYCIQQLKTRPQKQRRSDTRELRSASFTCGKKEISSIYMRSIN